MCSLGLLKRKHFIKEGNIKCKTNGLIMQVFARYFY